MPCFRREVGFECSVAGLAGFSASPPWAVGGDGVPSLAGVLRLHCHRLVYLRFLLSAGVVRCEPAVAGGVTVFRRRRGLVPLYTGLLSAGGVTLVTLETGLFLAPVG